MQSFISSLTEFIIGSLGYFVATVSGRFIITFILVAVAVLFMFKFMGK